MLYIFVLNSHRAVMAQVYLQNHKLSRFPETEIRNFRLEVVVFVHLLESAVFAAHRRGGGVPASAHGEVHSCE
jgi:hypothetical protein